MSEKDVEENITLNIVIIGSSAHEDQKGRTPTLSNVEESIIYSLNNNYELNIIFVDPMYYRLKFVDSTSSVSLQEEHELVTKLKNGGIEFIEEFYYRSKLNFKKEESVLYINYVKSVKNTFQFMHFIESYDTNLKYFYLPINKTERLNLLEVVEDFLSPKKNLIVVPYDLYHPKKIENYMSPEDLKELKKLIVDGCELNIWYIKAEIHKEDTGIPKIRMPCWTYNTEIGILKGIIKYYELYNDNKIHRPSREICSSSDYRMLLCHLLSKILSNFAVNNNLIKIKDVDSWFDQKLYEKIIKKISSFEG